MRTSLVAFIRPEDLNACIADLTKDRYHLFLNGRWIAVYNDSGELLQAYRQFARQGQACTVVAAGEIILYSVRSASSSEPSLEARMLQKLHANLEQPLRGW